MRVTVLLLAVAAMTALMPSGAAASDREIAQEIAQQIYASGQLSDYKVMVKYADGTAYIKGEVQTPGQMNTAVELARRNPNVQNVVNMVTIQGASAGQAGQGLRPTAPTAQMAAAPQFRQVSYDQPAQQSQASTPQGSTMQMRPVGNASPNHHLNVPTPPGMPAGMSAPRLGYAVQQASAENTPAAPQAETIQQTAPIQPIQARQMQRHPGQMMPVGRPIGQQAMPASHSQPGMFGAPVPSHMPAPGGVAPVRYDQPHLPSHAWPSYAAYPNYAAVTYPKQYSAAAWPYIGPFYPYPQVPLGWRKVTLEWDDGWWFLDFKQRRH